MIARLAIKIAAFALKRANLRTEDRLAITDILFDKIVAFPIHDIIRFNEEGTLLVNGRSLDVEKVRQIQSSAKAAKENTALELIHNQLRYEAMKTGINGSRVIEDALFAKAVIYCGEQERKLLRTLSGDGA